MRRNQKRIWEDYAFVDRKYSDQSVLSNREITRLIDGYSQWIDDYLVLGWEGYFTTVMFHSLRGDHRAKVMQMHRELTRMYGRLATRYVRNTRSPFWERLLPTGFFIPDYPVPKRDKGKIHDLYINDGLHMHGIILANRWARVREHFNVHISDNIDRYRIGSIQRIDVQPIVGEPSAVVGYAMKALYRRKVSMEDILIVPRSLSELPAR